MPSITKQSIFPRYTGWLVELLFTGLCNKVILGDFNLAPSNPSIASFMNNENLFNLVKCYTCFKGLGSCIDLILTNRKYFLRIHVPLKLD